MLKWLNPFNSLFGRILFWFWTAFVVLFVASSWMAKISYENPILTELNAEQQHYVQKQLAAIHRRERPDAPVYLFDDVGRYIGNHQVLVPPPNERAQPTREPRQDRGFKGENDRKERKIPAVVVDQLLAQREPKSIYWRGRFWLGPIDLPANERRSSQLTLVMIDGPDGGGKPVLDKPAIRWLIALLVRGICSLLLAYSLSKPLLSLRATSKKMALGDLTARPDTDLMQRGDEFGALARQTNEMAEQVEKLLLAQQSLLANVSHELRSPLTRLQLACEIARVKSTQSQTELDRIYQESQRLERMIGKLLKLSRLENKLQSIDVAPISLQTLVSQLLTVCDPEIKQKGLTIKCDSFADAMVQVDAELIYSALENGLRNAIRFSPEQAAISLSLSESATHWQLLMCDQGCGVPKEELATIFEPFSRASNSDHKGTGLGLAIAQQAMQRHRGQLYASANEPKGFCLIYEFEKA